MYNPQRSARRSPRLKGYDYSQDGAYFVTICTQNRVNLFGEIIEETVLLNPLGEIVKQAWFELPRHYHNIELDGFVVMPTHVLGIIFRVGENMVEEGFKPSPTSPP